MSSSHELVMEFRTFLFKGRLQFLEIYNFGRALDIRVRNSMTNSCLLLIKPNQIFNRTIVAGSLVKQTLIYPAATSQAKSSRAVGTEGAGVIAPFRFQQGQKLETLLFQNILAQCFQSVELCTRFCLHQFCKSNFYLKAKSNKTDGKEASDEASYEALIYPATT